MSNFRRAEIKRTFGQMHENFAAIRQFVSAAKKPDSEEYRMAMVGVSFAEAFIDLLGGMATDLNALVEHQEIADKKQEADLFDAQHPKAGYK